MDDKKKKLYDKLVEKQLYSKSYEEFESQFSSVEKQDALYLGLRNKGLYSKSADEFRDQFFKRKKVEAVSSESPLESAGKTINSDIKAQEITEPIAKPQSIADIPEEETRDEIALLYDQYKEAGAIKPDQEAAIDLNIENQAKGERSLWETFNAYMDGMLKTGMMVPMFRYDKKEDLLKARQEANKVDFLEALPQDKVDELNNYAVNRSIELSGESKNILAQNEIVKEKIRLGTKNLKHMASSMQKLKEQGSIPEEAFESFSELYKETTGAIALYNKNVDLIESKNEDIGSFAEELDLLKRNYDTASLEYYKEIARLSTADMLGGIMDFSTTTSEVIGELTGSDIHKSVAMVGNMLGEDFREELEKQRSSLAPMLSVSDINNKEDLGRWFAEQMASQIPILTTLGLTGGAGLGVIGMGAGGQKMGQMKDSNNAEINPTDYGLAEIFLSGVGTAVAEGGSELVTVGILSKGRRVMQAAGRAGKDQVKKGFGKHIQDLLVDAGSEGGSELGNQVAQNMMDIFFLGDKDVHILDGTADALASGVAIGAGMNVVPTAIGMGISALADKSKRDLITENTKKMQSIAKALEEGEGSLSPEAIKMLQKELESTAKKNNKLIEGVYDEIARLPEQDIDKLIKLDKSTNKLAQQAKEINDQDIPPFLKESLLEKLKKKADKIAEEKLAILEKAKNVKIEPVKEVEQTPTEPTKVESLEAERTKALRDAKKGKVRFKFANNTDIVNSKDPIANKEINDDLKDKTKRIRQFIKCL